MESKSLLDYIEIKKPYEFIHIKEPYLTAGRQYGWYPYIGVGISMRILSKAIKENKDIVLRIGNSLSLFISTPRKLLNWIYNYNSIEIIQGHPIGIVSCNNHLWEQYVGDNS